MLKTRKGTIIGNVPMEEGIPPSVLHERLLRIHEVRSITGLGRSTVYRLMAEGRFPQHLKLVEGGRTSPSAWRASEVAAWVAERCAGKAA